MSNTVSTNKNTIVHCDADKELAAICLLPKEIRCALDYAWFDYSAEQVLEVFAKAKQESGSEKRAISWVNNLIRLNDLEKSSRV